MQKITAFNPDELTSQSALHMPGERREEKLESIDERSIFVRAYFAGRKLFGMDKEVLEYDYSWLSKSKDSKKD